MLFSLFIILSRRVVEVGLNFSGQNFKKVKPLRLRQSNVISIKTSRAARKKYLQYGGRPSMTSSRDVTASPLHVSRRTTNKIATYGPAFSEENHVTKSAANSQNAINTSYIQERISL
jgi:hypothetical protein